MPPKKRDKEFILVRWLQDETVGVMPQSAVQKDSHVYVGAVTQVKYGRRFFDAEILKVSCEFFCFFFRTCSIYISRQG